MTKFRLLRGTHIESVPTGRKDVEGNVIKQDRMYRAGDVIETVENLLQQNCPGGALGAEHHYTKFEKVHEEPDGFVRAAIPAGSKIWDPSAETLEQFALRMKAEQNSAEPKTVADAAKAGFQTAFTDSKQSVDASKKPTAQRKLEDLNESDLIRLAEDNELNLKGTKGKDALVKLLKSANISA